MKERTTLDELLAQEGKREAVRRCRHQGSVGVAEHEALKAQNLSGRRSAERMAQPEPDQPPARSEGRQCHDRHAPARGKNRGPLSRLQPV
jgi:hypothetical protein